MKISVRLLENKQTIFALGGILLTLLAACGDLLLKVVFQQDINWLEGLLALLAYAALVGIVGFVFYAFQHRLGLFSYLVRKEGYLMDFKAYQAEPQFSLRDWTTTNLTYQQTILQIKRDLGELEENPSEPINKEVITTKTEGEEKSNEPIEVSNSNAKPKIGSILPSLHNSATLEDTEIAQIKNGLKNYSQRQIRAKMAS